MYATVNAAGESRQAPCCAHSALAESSVADVRDRILNSGFLPPPKLACVKGLYAGRALTLRNSYDLIGSDENDETVSLIIPDAGLSGRHLFVQPIPGSLAFPVSIRDFSSTDGVYIKIRHLSALPLQEDADICFEYLVMNENALTEPTTGPTCTELNSDATTEPTMTGSRLRMRRGNELSECDAFWDLMRVYQIPRDLRYNLVVWLNSLPTGNNTSDLFSKFQTADLSEFGRLASEPLSAEVAMQLALMQEQISEYLPWRELSRPLLLTAENGMKLADVRWFGAHLVPYNAPLSLPPRVLSGVNQEVEIDIENIGSKQIDESPIPNSWSPGELRTCGNFVRPAGVSSCLDWSLWWRICDASSSSLNIAIESHPKIPSPYIIKSGSPKSDPDLGSYAFSCSPLYHEMGQGLPILPSMLPDVELYESLGLDAPDPKLDKYRCNRWLARTPLQCTDLNSLPEGVRPELRLPPHYGTGYHLSISYKKGQYMIHCTYPADCTELSGIPATLRSASAVRDAANIDAAGRYLSELLAPPVDLVTAVWVRVPTTPTELQDALVAKARYDLPPPRPAGPPLPRETTVDHSLDPPAENNGLTRVTTDPVVLECLLKQSVEPFTIATPPNTPPPFEERLSESAAAVSLNSSTTRLTLDAPDDAYKLRFGDTLRVGNLEFLIKRFNEGTACLQGYRQRMEDEEVTQDDLCVSDVLPVSFYGIYDGHGGRECAAFLKQELHLAFMHHLQVVSGELDKAHSAEGAIFEALYRAFVITDRAYLRLHNRVPPATLPGENSRWLERFNAHNSKQLLSTTGTASGSAAVVVVIVGNQIWCANTGDTRGLICRRDGEAVQLSLDHKPDRFDEEIRIEQAGGYVRNRRVLGRLAVSRAFGDIEYKNVGTGLSALVVPDPEIRLIYNLQPDDDFLLLACDGLFDVYDSQELVEHIRAMLADETNAQLVVEDLILDAIEKRMSQDNVSATLILFGREA